MDEWIDRLVEKKTIEILSSKTNLQVTIKSPSEIVKLRRLQYKTSMNEFKWKRFRGEKKNSLFIFTIWWIRMRSYVVFINGSISLIQH